MSVSWNKLYEAIEPLLLRIETQSGSGTGFLFGYNKTGEFAAIATAGHVVRMAYTWKQALKLVHHTSGDSVFLDLDKRFIFMDEQRGRDSAVIVVATKHLKGLPKDVYPLMDPTKYMRIGVAVGWVGFPYVAHPKLCFFRGYVSAFEEGQDCYLIDGVAINGVSGGPVFIEDTTTKLRIIGSVSAYIANRATGEALPGLLQAHDISWFQQTLSTIHSYDDARAKEREAAQSAVEAATASGKGAPEPARNQD